MAPERSVGAALLVAFALVACDPKKEAVAASDASPSPSASVTTTLPSPAVDASAPAPSVTAVTTATGSDSATGSGAKPVSAQAPLDTSCTKDDDCVPAPGCCPAPCTSLVINQKDLERAREHNQKTCPSPRQCMSAGGCRTHAYLCVRKTCKLVYTDSPDYRERK